MGIAGGPDNLAEVFASIQDSMQQMMRDIVAMEDKANDLRRGGSPMAMYAGKPRDVQVASGAFAVIKSHYLVKPETGTADAVDTITGGNSGKMLILQNKNAGDTITYSDGADNIDFGGRGDIIISDTKTLLLLLWDVENDLWLQLPSV